MSLIKIHKLTEDKKMMKLKNSVLHRRTYYDPLAGCILIVVGYLITKVGNEIKHKTVTECFSLP